MGTLVGHIAPAGVLVVVGIWHLFSLFINYVRSPRDYRAKAWYPVNWLPHRLKHIELYLILILVPIAIFYELGVSTNFRPLVNGVIPKNRVTSFEHATTLVMFWMYAVIGLLSETTNLLPLPTDASFLFASLAFALEWISIAHQAARNTGLESHCNLLLAYIAGLCAASAGMVSLDTLPFSLPGFLEGFSLSLERSILFFPNAVSVFLWTCIRSPEKIGCVFHFRGEIECRLGYW